MAIDYKLSADEKRAITQIRQHAEVAANRKVHGEYAKHDPSDPQVRKLADKYVDEVQRNLYQRTKGEYKPGTTLNGDFYTSGTKDNLKLRCASKPKTFDIPSSWIKREGRHCGEEWTPKDLGL
ncbi:MAG: hypothetical protein SFW65_01060 [Alphaproteobacteria bacterium]|nr:hypothetical protein [Alphaproteobacteria bacterium]